MEMLTMLRMLTTKCSCRCSYKHPWRQTPSNRQIRTSASGGTHDPLGAQIPLFGAPSGGHAADQVVGHIGGTACGYEAEGFSSLAVTYPGFTTTIGQSVCIVMQC